MPLHVYVEHVRATNKLTSDQLNYALIGLFGEVGSLMEAAKKLGREGPAYMTFPTDAEEEFGDAFWYFTLLCILAGEPLEDILSDIVAADPYAKALVATDQVGAPVAAILSCTKEPQFLECIVALGEAAAALFVLRTDQSDKRSLLRSFLEMYLHCLQASQLGLLHVVSSNIEKTASRFSTQWSGPLPDFDRQFERDEQLPEHFEIEIVKRPDGLTVLKWRGVIIGDPLSDNIEIEDGYRYHDVFHLAHAAILGWSPVFRALIKHKRKSDRSTDEAQDGGRAIVIEEGLTAWIFARSKDYEHFSTTGELPFDFLKIIQQFVAGYEVEACPLWLWERAILDGYSVFRKVLENGGGVVVGDRPARTIEYRPISTQ